MLNTYEQIVTPELSTGAILNEEFHGFREDYLVLHCLLRIHKPSRFFEVGTNMGRGTAIICNALGPSATVFSLDLPPEKAHVSLQHPISEKQKHSVGHLCNFPFTQVFGDSREYDFAQHGPIDGFYIDAEHVYENVLVESRKAFACEPKIVVWHDCDIEQVWNGVNDALNNWHTTGKTKYELIRVQGTRIGYAIPAA